MLRQAAQMQDVRAHRGDNVTRNVRQMRGNPVSRHRQLDPTALRLPRPRGSNAERGSEIFQPERSSPLQPSALPRKLSRRTIAVPASGPPSDPRLASKTLRLKRWSLSGCAVSKRFMRRLGGAAMKKRTHMSLRKWSYGQKGSVEPAILWPFIRGIVAVRQRCLVALQSHTEFVSATRKSEAWTS